MFDRPYNLSPNIFALKIVEVGLCILLKIISMSYIGVTFGLSPKGKAMYWKWLKPKYRILGASRLDMASQDDVDNCVMRGFIICTFRHMSNQGRWTKWADTSHACARWEIHDILDGESDDERPFERSKMWQCGLDLFPQVRVRFRIIVNMVMKLWIL
jgi:hypothetical protein